jgi:transposase
MKKYVIEARNENRKLDMKKEMELRKVHPYLFSSISFTIDQLCHYAAFGQGRDLRIGPWELGAWMQTEGISYRVNYWS